jgi:hypothetical protein
VSELGFKIVDRRTGQRITSLSYISEQGARNDIRSLWHRQRVGSLLNVDPVVIANATVVPEEESND